MKTAEKALWALTWLLGAVALVLFVVSICWLVGVTVVTGDETYDSQNIPLELRLHIASYGFGVAAFLPAGAACLLEELR